MKKCPYCSAELLDDAEFCLYCMRGLSEKRFAEHKLKKPYLKFAVTGVLTALVICAVLITVVKLGLKGAVINNSDSAALPIQNAQGVFFEPNGYSGKQSDANGTSHSAANSSVGYSSNSAQTAYASDNSGGSSDNKTTVISSNSKTSSASETAKGGSSDGNSVNSKVESTGESSGAQSDTETQESSSQAPSDSTDQEQPQQTWSVKNADGGVEITGIENINSNGVYEIPSQIDGKTVVGIGDRAFYYENIKSITLPDTLKYISDQAFSNCKSLTRIVIPKSVTKIGVNAFLPCDKLADIYLASADVQIASYAFSDIYNRSVSLTIHAPELTSGIQTAIYYCDAAYEQWNG